MRIFYLCPEINNPVGGIKVIYKHVDIINKIEGWEAYVVHPNKPNFRCGWFTNETKTLCYRASWIGKNKWLNHISSDDLVIIPEVWVEKYAQILCDYGISYGIFVQNGYQLGLKNSRELDSKIVHAYNSSLLILSISEDASDMVRLLSENLDKKIIRLIYSVSEKFNLGEKKENLITYMPRKLKEHSQQVVSFIKLHLPDDWEIMPIDKKSEDETAAILRKSKIFLSFSDREGLPVPPVEAALSGNYVIGYTGQGGKEYFDFDSFVEVECGNFRKFIMETMYAVANYEKLSPLIDSGRSKVKQKFSNIAEIEKIHNYLIFLGL